MLKSIPKHILIPLVTLVTGLFFGSALQIALAWTVPSATPPGNNVAPPLNTSAVDQAKTGSLTVNGAGERMQAPRFIDNDNTNFFLDPNSSSKLSFAEFNNLNSLGYVNANVNMVAGAYMQSPIFYDNNNISFYLDSNGTSKLNHISMTGQLGLGLGADTPEANRQIDSQGYIKSRTGFCIGSICIDEWSSGEASLDGLVITGGAECGYSAFPNGAMKAFSWGAADSGSCIPWGDDTNQANRRPGIITIPTNPLNSYLYQLKCEDGNIAVHTGSRNDGSWSAHTWLCAKPKTVSLDGLAITGGAECGYSAFPNGEMKAFSWGAADGGSCIPWGDNTNQANRRPGIITIPTNPNNPYLYQLKCEDGNIAVHTGSRNNAEWSVHTWLCAKPKTVSLDGLVITGGAECGYSAFPNGEMKAFSWGAASGGLCIPWGDDTNQANRRPRIITNPTNPLNSYLYQLKCEDGNIAVHTGSRNDGSWSAHTWLCAKPKAGDSGTGGSEGLYQASCWDDSSSPAVLCVRIKTDNGSTHCKYADATIGWTNCPAGNPFVAEATGNIGLYKITCWDDLASAAILCVRTKTDNGTTECKYVDGTHGWTNCIAGSPW